MTQLQKLELYETASIFSLGSYSAGVIEKKLEFQGASLISSLYLKSLSVGTTIAVAYYESTTGDDFGEDVLLQAHTIPVVGGTNKILVPRPHAKPRLRVTITGTGVAEFGVYATSTSEFVTSSGPTGAQDVNIVSPSPLPVTIKDDTDNIRTSILKAQDRRQSLTTTDFGTIDERVTQIDYFSATVYPDKIARKTLEYILVTLPSGLQAYKRTDINWDIIDI